MSFRKRKREREGASISKYFRVSNSSDSCEISGQHTECSDESGETHDGVERDSSSETGHAELSVPLPVINEHMNCMNDLGLIIGEAVTDSEVSRAVLGLTSGQKYTLLTSHYRPERNFVFPKTFSDGCGRSFQEKWLDKYPWLVYSKHLDGGFCKFCSLFARKRNTLGVLVNKPFRRWVKVNKIVDNHASHKYHTDAVEAALAFKQSVDQPQFNVDVRLNVELVNTIQENRHILKCCAQCILYCGRQCIALRGDTEKLSQPGNPGNFLSMLKVLANYDAILKRHLEKPRQRHATYISPRIQNEIIDIIGKHIIQKSILEKIQQARFFSVMVDEVTSHNTEVMPLCIRFVDADKCIREEFIQFSTLARVTGKSIAAQICSDLRSLELNIENIRGQGYDGAANMSSDRTGVQAHIRKESPLAVYTHCTGHCLNLVISHSSTIPVIRAALDKMKTCCLYFLNSPKRNGLLLEIVAKSVVETNKRKPLIDLCKTRWTERHSAYQHFYQCYVYIIMSLEVISMGLHKSELSENYTDASWDQDSKSTANSLLNGLTDFDFIAIFLTAYHFLSHLTGITVKLQSTTIDIIDAYQQIDEIKSFYKEVRKNITDEFHKVYQQSKRMAATVNVEPSKPRSCARQRHRPNADAETIEDWYRVNVAIPFLDHIIQELDSRFSGLAQTASKLLGLVPAVLCKREIDMTEVVQLYSNDMTSPELFMQELTRWKIKYLAKLESDRPSSCASALRECDQDLYPNIYTLLQIACSLPVTSCECERNASALRRLRNFMRAGMTESRLTSLALMHIHYEKDVDLDTVVDLFAKMHPRRLQLSTVLFEAT